MDFALSDEQQMIQHTAAAFLRASSPSGAVRTAMATELGFDPQLWQRICREMVWPGMHIPERYGGLGLGYVEQVCVLEQMGRHLLCSPYFATVALAANALLRCASEQQKHHYLPLIVEGQTATLAYQGDRPEAVTAHYRREGEAFVLSGDYQQVLDGHSAELVIVAARAEGSDGEQGISLFAVAQGSTGLTAAALPSLDQTRRLAHLQLEQVRLPASSLLGAPGEAWPGLAQTLDLARIALAAEQLGGMQQLLDSAVEYSKQRQQFNRPIASFQAIKHMAADMMLRCETSRSAVYYAACIADQVLQEGGLAGELAEAASMAKSWCSEAYFSNAGDALQIHGGVGFTWEYDVHLYFKRAKASEAFLGDSGEHRERIAKRLLA